MIRQVIEVQKKIHPFRDTHLALEISLSIPASHACLTASLRVSFRASGMSRGVSLNEVRNAFGFFDSLPLVNDTITLFYYLLFGYPLHSSYVE